MCRASCPPKLRLSWFLGTGVGRLSLLGGLPARSATVGLGGALLDAEACAAAGALLARRPYVPLGSCLTPASEAAGVLGTYPSRATTAAL